MTNTLATTVVVPNDLASNNGGASPTASFNLATILPEAQRKPRLFVGADNDGNPFYAWDSENQSRIHQQARSFTAQVEGVRTQVVNEGTEKESTKLILDLALEATGECISLSMGVQTYSALSLVAAMSGLTAEELAAPIGISGKAGSKGVVFISVYCNGKSVRNMEAEDLLKESRKDGKQLEAIQGYVAEINDKLA